MARLVPVFPYILFGVLDPLALTSQFLISLLTPYEFLAALSRYPTPPPPLNPSTLVATTQLGLMYLIIAALTLITFHVTTDVKVIKGWLAVTAAVDVLYIYSFYLGMGGWKGFGDVRAWSGGESTNVGATAFMIVAKVMTFLEIFGEIGGRKRVEKRKN